jgi:CheY-like chemotaxis protein
VKVLVAHEDPDVREAIKTAVERSGHEVLSSKDGVDALMKIQRDHPRVVVVDAALPRMHGFEICEFLKRDERLREIKVILLEPCTARSRHKRSAENIYGADDIVDAQRVREDLPARLTGLIAGSLPVSERASTGSEQLPSADSSSRVASPIERQSEGLPSGGGGPRVRNAGAGSDTAADPDPLEVEREKARRLARIIVSDIALYNEGLIELGLRKGGLVDLLRDHLEEGYRLFRSRVRESIAEEADYVREALDAFVERKRGELGIENPGGGPEGNGIGKDER